MTSRIDLRPSRPAGALLALGVFATSPAAVFAQANPYYVGVTAGLGHTTNITLAPEGAVRADGARAVRPDVFTSAGLVAGVNQPFGRQRFYANGSVSAVKYQDDSQFDNTSYNLATGLDWATVERLSGNLNLGLNQRLEYPAGSLSRTDEKNIARTGQFGARVQWGLVELMALEAAASHREVRYSAASYANNRLDQDSLSLGVRRRLGGQLDIGAALRFGKGKYPLYDFDRRDIDLTANWAVTGQSTLNARLSVGKQDNDGQVQDFSGATGQVQWAYMPTGKLSFLTVLKRDTGAESGVDSVNRQITLPDGQTFTSPFSEPGTSDNSRLTTTIALTARYAATAKINVSATASQSRRTLQRITVLQDGTPASNETGRDTTTLFSIGVNYAPTRNWLLGCEASRNSRSADTALSYAYGATSASCSAQFVLR